MQALPLQLRKFRMDASRYRRIDFFKNALLDSFALQYQQGFLWLPVFLGLGVVTYFSLYHEPGYWIAALFVFFALGVGAYEKYVGAFTPFLKALIVFCICFGLGFGAAKMRTAQIYTPILQKELKAVEINGRVGSIEVLSDGGMRVLIKNPVIEDLEAERTPRKVRVKVRKYQELYPGMVIRGVVGLNPPSPPVFPGGFDFQRYMFFQGIGGVGFSYGAFEVLETPGKGFVEHLETLRQSVAAQAVERLPNSGGVAAALLVGQKKGISEADEDAMRHSGLAHMLAISGLHIGLVFGFVFFAVRLCLAALPDIALRHPIKKYAAAAAAAMCVAGFYMFVAGATIPTQRALLMVSVAFLAILMDRTPLSMRLVAFAAIVVLMIAPHSLMSASFQMSFAAVASLVAFYEWIRPWWSDMHRRTGVWRRVGLYVLGMCMTSVIATFATAPFALFHFQQVAIYGLLGNVLSIPILGFIVMPAAVMYFVLMPLGLEAWPLSIMGYGIQWILSVAHFVSDLDGAVLRGVQWPTSVLLFFTAAFLIVILIKGALRFIALPLLAVCFFIIININQYDVLVSSNSKLVGLGQNEGWLFSSMRGESFAASNGRKVPVRWIPSR